VSELTAQMLSFEARVDLRSGGSGSSANLVRCGHDDFGRGGPVRGRGGRGGRFPARGHGEQSMSSCGGCGGNNSDWPQCQVCHKIRYIVDRCWYIFDEEFVLEEKHTTAARTTSYAIDTDWYADSGATDHITSELDKLAIRDKYNGTKKVHTASRAGMEISSTIKSFIHTPYHKLELSNVLHVSKATKNLLSIHRFSLDNNVFFEIHHWFFLIKDQDTRSILLRGKCRDGLYPFAGIKFYQVLLPSQ
jgi:hypothetical protein